ncbi:MAG: BON domain-containing protein [Chitinophagaceae bacterium]|nr:BON domain-containing protein [Chitinophagaceae bacterium]
MKKMKIRKILFAVLLMASTFIIGCKPKDADIQANVEKKIKTNTEMTGAVTASVNDGVATISGECKDEACKAKCGELTASVKGVKSVVNNMMVPAPVVINTDNALTTGARQAAAAYDGVTADVSDGVVTLRGSIKRSDLSKLMQSINALQPKSVKNELQVK